jgi:hypothetical protein
MGPSITAVKGILNPLEFDGHERRVSLRGDKRSLSEHEREQVTIHE